MIDLIVAGGGPVGLATAIHAAREGLETVVVEPRRGPIDKACGEGLMPDARARLRALGIEPAGIEFVGIRYQRGPHVAEARFTAGPGIGVRRTVLHAAMLDRAAELGVRIMRGRVTDVAQTAAWVEAAGIRARYLAAADGLHSDVRRSLGLSAGARASRAQASNDQATLDQATRVHASRAQASVDQATHDQATRDQATRDQASRPRGPRLGRPRAPRYGVRQHFRASPWSDLVEVHWLAEHEVYVTPASADSIGVAVLGPSPLNLAEAIAAVPSLASELAGADPAGTPRGAGPLRQSSTARVAGRVLLLGDAAGYVDALTGEGLRIGFAEAEAAVGAILNDRPENYEAEWKKITRSYRIGTSALLWVGERPRLRPLVVPAARAMPRTFTLIVDRIAGHQP